VPPTDGETRDAFDLIPKVERHCHVEGTLRPTTVKELAAKAGRPLPVDDVAELYRYDSLDSFLAVFWLVQEILVAREDWARIAYESLVDGSAHGLRYREMFFTPARHLAAGHWPPTAPGFTVRMGRATTRPGSAGTSNDGRSSRAGSQRFGSARLGGGDGRVRGGRPRRWPRGP
jgi:hypothetical protein